MAAGGSGIDDVVQSAGIEGVFMVSALKIENAARPLTIAGRPITAIAPHPSADDLVYVTSEHPETLSFLPDPYTLVDDLPT